MEACSCAPRGIFALFFLHTHTHTHTHVYINGEKSRPGRLQCKAHHLNRRAARKIVAPYPQCTATTSTIMYDTRAGSDANQVAKPQTPCNTPTRSLPARLGLSTLRQARAPCKHTHAHTRTCIRHCEHTRYLAPARSKVKQSCQFGPQAESSGVPPRAAALVQVAPLLSESSCSTSAVAWLLKRRPTRTVLLHPSSVMSAQMLSMPSHCIQTGMPSVHSERRSQRKCSCAPSPTAASASSSARDAHAFRLPAARHRAIVLGLRSVRYVPGSMPLVLTKLTLLLFFIH